MARRILALLALVAAASCGGEEGPNIEFSVVELDAGRILEGEELSYEFPFTNAGGGTLRITDVDTNCDCLVPGDPPGEVAPGARGSIPVRLRTRGLHGNVLFTVTVWTNDAASKASVLRLKGEVWDLVEFPRFGANLGTVKRDEPAQKTLTLSNRFHSPLDLRNARCDPPKFAVALRAIAPGQEYELTVRTVPPLEVGAHAAKITIETGVKQKPELSIDASCYVSPDVTVVPDDRISLPAAPLARGTVRKVLVVCTGAEPLRLSDVRVDDARVSVTQRTVAEGARIMIVLTFPKGWAVPAGKTVALTFRTNYASHAEFRIPVDQ
ncbi:MAG: DUF1573 domain-containing protein [Planctomycetota bacterium]|jgi:hypothetical protein